MQTLVDLLRQSAERYGDSTALTITPGFRQQRWSFQRLWDFSEGVAALLAERGLQKGDRAIIWSVNRPEWVAAFFGCMRAGVVAVPLDVRTAPDFVERVVEFTEPKLAFLSRQTPDGPLPGSVPIVLLDDLEDLVESAEAGADLPNVGADDLAEVMFTSGTTGDPKGVMLSHGNIVTNVQAAVEAVPIRPSDRLFSLLPLSHMLEQTGGLLAPLSGGASVVYPVSRQPTVIFKTLRANRVTNIVLVPQALQLFMNGIEREVSAQGKDRQWRLLQGVASKLPMPMRRALFRPVHKRMGGRIRFFMSGGAYLDPELQRKWGTLGIRVMQGYGATEASPVITTNSLDRQKPGSVGRVLAGQDVRIAEDGEVLTRGPNVTRGYWRNEAATEAAFEDGWYRTGDLGFVDDDGFLFLKGRKKDLIVLANGQNVYPEDIETALGKQPGVREAVVLGMPSEDSSVEVHAALLLEEAADADEIVRSANAVLADHQRIQGSTVWPEEEFPRTHTLKVKKQLVLDHLLQERDGGRVETAAPPAAKAAPVNDVHRIAAMISEMPADQLGDDSILADDLGLDSLGRVELLSDIESELGAYVDDDRVGPETTLGELTAMVEEGAQVQPMKFPTWGRAWWCRLLRAGLQYAFIFTTLHLFYRVRIYGRENLDGLRGPVLFASNHNVKLDSPVTLMALPAGWRWRVSPAAAADDIFGPRLKGMANVLLGNAFPFAREGSIRASLEQLGRLLDMGWSILIYPEGGRYPEGMQPFKSGTGLIAVESRTPVVPIRVRLHKATIWDRGPLLSRGKIDVHFGEPVVFPRGADYLEATARLESAVKEL